MINSRLFWSNLFYFIDPTEYCYESSIASHTCTLYR